MRESHFIGHFSRQRRDRCRCRFSLSAQRYECMIVSRLLWFGLSVIATGAVGCTVAQVGMPLQTTTPIQVGETTKEAVYESLGVPNEIEYQENETTLIYGFAEGKGLGVGVEFQGFVIFDIGNVLVGTDTLLVKIGPDGRVAGIRSFLGTQIVKYTLWPFD